MGKNYFEGRGFSSGGNSSQGLKENRAGKGSSYFIESKSSMDEIYDQYLGVFEDAAKQVANYAIRANKNAAGNIRGIQGEIEKLLDKFDSPERAKILTRAVAIMIANI